MNSVSVTGFIEGEPIKREVEGRTVVAFRLAVGDEVSDGNGGHKIKRYIFTVFAWDLLALKVLHNYSKGEHLIVEGKLTSRGAKGQSILKVEIVAFLVEQGASTDEELEGPRREAQTLAEISRNGLPF